MSTICGQIMNGNKFELHIPHFLITEKKSSIVNS